MEGKIGLKILCEAQGSADGFGVEYVYLETQRENCIGSDVCLFIPVSCLYTA